MNWPQIIHKYYRLLSFLPKKFVTLIYNRSYLRSFFLNYIWKNARLIVTLCCENCLTWAYSGVPTHFY